MIQRYSIGIELVEDFDVGESTSRLAEKLIELLGKERIIELHIKKS